MKTWKAIEKDYDSIVLEVDPSELKDVLSTIQESTNVLWIDGASITTDIPVIRDEIYSSGLYTILLYVVKNTIGTQVLNSRLSYDWIKNYTRDYFSRSYPKIKVFEDLGDFCKEINDILAKPTEERKNTWRYGIVKEKKYNHHQDEYFYTYHLAEVYNEEIWAEENTLFSVEVEEGDNATDSQVKKEILKCLRNAIDDIETNEIVD